jgi:hypothetical protein
MGYFTSAANFSGFVEFGQFDHQPRGLAGGKSLPEERHGGITRVLL